MISKIGHQMITADGVKMHAALTNQKQPAGDRNESVWGIDRQPGTVSSLLSTLLSALRDQATRICA